ncbi:hypothetical protein ACAF76_020825 [Brevibacillus sp. TJ4]|uniref:hypothetical protein n=1 Tax=Brevibacillus sp. TJ4 TaxID=3234853 RepID=UPI0037D529A5
MKGPKTIWKRVADERGATMVTALLFFFCLGTLLSILLLQEQADFWEMRVQHTADIISKGARAAGKWEYVDSFGEEQKMLFATTEEAESFGASIIRGAREEAAILWEMNRPHFDNRGDSASIVHQRGERDSLYRQGVYHVRVTLEREIPLFWDLFDLKIEKVSQSEI